MFTTIDDDTHLSDATQLSEATRLSDATRPATIRQSMPISDDTVARPPHAAAVPRPPAHPAVSSTPLRRTDDVAPANRRHGTAANTHPTRHPNAATPTGHRPDSAALGIADFQRSFDALAAGMSTVLIGKTIPIRQCVTAVMAGGHVLLEDDPGTGKTQLARGLANCLAVSFKRIQFTPDLLPSDVLGVTFYDQRRGAFEFREGPVFASIVLADEINRASPKTQSALLEVMEERKVTVDGISHDVPSPFMVVATQNPIEQLGTYPLPEAQMDRFLMKISIGHPGHDAALELLRQVDIDDRARHAVPVCTGRELLHLRQVVSTVHVDDAIREYIIRLVEHTRHSSDIAIGVSMRGALALTRCARIWAAANGRAYVLPDDVRDLAVPILAHRITLAPEAVFQGTAAPEAIARILAEVPVPAVGARRGAS